MYNTALSASGAGVMAAGAGPETLAFTGANSLWLALAAFAMVAAGSAVLRIMPKAQTQKAEI